MGKYEHSNDEPTRPDERGGETPLRVPAVAAYESATYLPATLLADARGEIAAATPPGPGPCPSCGGVCLAEHRFCPHCGFRLPVQQTGPAAGRTLFFGAMQAPGKAKLILIRGEGQDGLAYHLTGSEHVAGRSEGQILFPEDPYLSPRHANFCYRNGKLHVRDEGSANGVFLQIRWPQGLTSGDLVLIGEQLLRVEAPAADAGPLQDDEGTFFYGSPKRACTLQVTQLLRGGQPGLSLRTRSSTITIGREGNDINFPDDPFISGRHGEISLRGDEITLSDLGSKNGTFYRAREETPLSHGDYVFIGQQLLRIEVV